jgi:hypothetical protein
MRINRLWKPWKRLPVLGAMPKMISELEERTDAGFLGFTRYWASPRSPKPGPSGQVRVVYNNMPATGLGAATNFVPAAGRKATAASRAGVRDEAYPEDAGTERIEV